MTSLRRNRHHQQLKYRPQCFAAEQKWRQSLECRAFQSSVSEAAATLLSIADIALVWVAVGPSLNEKDLP